MHTGSINTGTRMRGVALIMVLLLLSMAVLIAADIMERLEQDRTRTENILLLEQTWAWLLSAEALGMRALAADQEEDRRSGKNIDACSEKEWAIDIGPLSYDTGIFSVSIQDLQGRFNLNNLVASRDGGSNIDRLQIERLKRLLRLLLPNAEAADALAEEAADWIDSNTLVDGLGGAEDSEYDAWRTGNVPFAHVSELRGLRSATVETWQVTGDKPLFSRYITALPETVRLNVNTAPAEVLQSMVSGLSSTQVNAITDFRRKEPFDTVDAVLALPELAALGAAEKTELKAALVVNSEYFRITTQVQMAGRTARLVSDVYRPAQNGVPQVVRRDLGEIFSTPESACNPGWQTDDVAQEKQG